MSETSKMFVQSNGFIQTHWFIKQQKLLSLVLLYVSQEIINSTDSFIHIDSFKDKTYSSDTVTDNIVYWTGVKKS